MKTVKSNTFIVKLAKDDIKEFDINLDVFEDPFLEAATRAFENSTCNKEVLPRILIECWNKTTPKKVVLFNSYKVLVNAGKYSAAENLREKIMIQNELDLAQEPLRD